jgi:hypothetical protein
MDEKLRKAADAGGLTEHGRATIAVCVGSPNFEEIPDDKAPKIIQLLGNADNVKLFNAGKNTKGKTVNPKSTSDEMKELADAFKASSAEVEKVPDEVQTPF